jgi:hypothetical protein
MLGYLLFSEKNNAEIAVDEIEKVIDNTNKRSPNLQDKE